MDGRAFLGIANELLQGATEAHWRAAVGRSYYALMLEGRAALERWGFVVPRRDQINAFVRLRFLYATDPDLVEIGKTLDWHSGLRNEADYQLRLPGSFKGPARATRAVMDAQTNVTRLDQVEADAPRRAAAIAGMKAKWP